MTVTIHVPHADRPTVARQLADIAGDRGLVKSATAGFTVSGDVALAYLTAAVATPCCATAPPRLAAPAPLAARVRGAEVGAGIGDPDTRTSETKPRTARTRKATTTAPPEE